VLIQQTGLVTLPALQPHLLTFDVEKDLVAVGLVNHAHSYLLGRKTLEPNTLPELVAWMKGPGKPAKFAHPGAGSMGALTTALFAKAVDVEINAIPYRGVAPALNDLVGGHVDLVFNGLTSALPLIKSGKLRPLGMTSLKRAGALPEVPTVDEQGLKGFQAVAWNGLTAPARTPKAVIDKINADVLKVIRSPELVEKLKAEGSDPVGSSVDQYARFLREEIAKWNKVIKFANIKGL
jgi:tripartite-type tricarboxylate transporter receptor subunit TctC